MYDGLNWLSHTTMNTDLTVDQIKELIVSNPSEYLHDEEGDEVIDSVEIREITKEEYLVLSKYIG